MGHYTYRDLAQDASDQGTALHWTTAHKIVRGTRQPSAALVRSLVQVLVPYLDEDEALIAAGFAPNNARERLLQSTDIESVEVEEDESPWLEDIPVAHANESEGGGLVDQFAFWPVRRRRQGNRLKLRIRGECMIPTVEPGDYVVIDLEDSPKDRDIVVVETEGFLSLRRYHIGSKGAWFTCENPNAPDASIPVWPETRVYRVVEHTETAEKLRKSGR